MNDFMMFFMIVSVAFLFFAWALAKISADADKELSEHWNGKIWTKDDDEE